MCKNEISNSKKLSLNEPIHFEIYIYSCSDMDALDKINDVKMRYLVSSIPVKHQ